MYTNFFIEYPEEPQEMSVGCAMARLIDGLGFRLHWAMEGLTEEDCAYRVCEGAMSIGEILKHVLGLVNWVHMHVYGKEITRPPAIVDQGYETLRILEQMRGDFLSMSDEKLSTLSLESRSFWDYINMPLSDALSHVGQVSLLRRAAGNPNRVNAYFAAKKKHRED